MGTLFIVSTPIGNLEDMTLRAVEVLKSVDVILCEDSRVCGKLLKKFGIEKRMIPFNDFNEESKTPGVLADLKAGLSFALVSDAGTPLVSDPGYKLARDVIASGINLEVIPGASAPIAALAVSGLPPDKFLFVGYLPKKDGKRLEMLKKIKEVRNILKVTVICFESPYRVLITFSGIAEVLGDIEIVVCRELTKIHEEVLREKVSKAIEHFEKFPPKGEFVILF